MKMKLSTAASALLPFVIHHYTSSVAAAAASDALVHDQTQTKPGDGDTSGENEKESRHLRGKKKMKGILTGSDYDWVVGNYTQCEMVSDVDVIEGNVVRVRNDFMGCSNGDVSPLEVHRLGNDDDGLTFEAFGKYNGYLFSYVGVGSLNARYEGEITFHTDHIAIWNGTDYVIDIEHLSDVGSIRLSQIQGSKDDKTVIADYYENEVIRESDPNVPPELAGMHFQVLATFLLTDPN